MIKLFVALGLGGFVLTEATRYSIKNGWTKKLTGHLENKIKLDIKFGAILVFIGFALISLGHALGG